MQVVKKYTEFMNKMGNGEVNKCLLVRNHNFKYGGSLNLTIGLWVQIITGIIILLMNN